ncbi:MAG: internalin A [bacterium]|jgi:internalin A
MKKKTIDKTTKKTVLELIEKAQNEQGLSLSLLDLNLRKVPEAVWKLHSLQSLNLGKNNLTEISSNISQLKELRHLWVFGNELKKLPDSIWALTKLKSLHVHSNKITELPDIPNDLEQLEILDARSNLIMELPDTINHLINLKKLRLNNNRLIKLPSQIQYLRKLQTLHFMENVAFGIPPEIIQKSPSEILEYYFRSAATARKLNEAKVLFVGQGAVGKTSLIRRLLDHSFNAKEEKTEGIAIRQWGVEYSADDFVRLNIWDFGGQEIMHATHQFFLTKRSLYILVLSARAGENQSNLYYWLEMIRIYGENSPVLIVINKCDQHYDTLDENRLYIDYKNKLKIVGFHYISCKSGHGIAELEKRIAELACSLPHVSDLLPLEYFTIKERMELLAKNTDFITDDEYQTICNQNNVHGKDCTTLLRFLHDLGSILHYDDPEQVYQLCDTKVLNPEWVTGGVYRFLNDSELLRAGNGVVERLDLNRILSCDAESRRRYPEQRHRFLVDMMRKYEICFDFPFEPKKLLLPELLSKNEPDVGWINSSSGHDDILDFEYWYVLLPQGLIPRFILRMHHHLTDTPTYWRAGVVLNIEQCRALVRGDSRNSKVYIQIQGQGTTHRQIALSIIRSCLDGIHKTYGNLKIEAKIPLPNDPEAPPVDYEFLLKLERSGVVEQWFEKSKRQYKIQELLSGVAVRNFDLFLSHGTNDKPLVRKLRDELHKRGLCCWMDEFNLTLGRPWQKEIIESMRKCRYIAVLIGPNGSGDWHSKECQLSLIQAESHGIPVIPIILPGGDIESNQLPTEFEFLKLLTWMDFGAGFSDEGILRLVRFLREDS